MAVQLLSYQVADLCLGKPPLRSLSSSATVSEALCALKSTEDTSISVWNCSHLSSKQDCLCIGKLSMVDITTFLCKTDNLTSPNLAFNSPVSALLSKPNGLVKQVEPTLCLLEAIYLMLQGAQNLVVPIKSSKRKPVQKSICTTANHKGQEFCWLTQEDVIRFLLSSIGLFSPISTLSIDSLGIINQQIFTINYDSPAALATEDISQSVANQTSVAVIDEDGTLIGEISPIALAFCDETAAAAITTLSAGDLMAYIDSVDPPEEIMRMVKSTLKERNLEAMLEHLEIDHLSDEELPFPTRSGRHSRSGSYSARMMRRAEAIVCYPGSSLVAVMIQAITHRVNYVWVIDEDDCSVLGIVTFANILEVFHQNLEPIV